MDETFRRKILRLLDQHRTTRIATLRSDGWPQVTTVGYANDGLVIYFLCGADSQKAANLAKDDRVSLTVDDDPTQVMDIVGLSMAARAKLVTNPAEFEKALHLLISRYPNQKGLDLPMPNTSEVCVFRVTPTIVSLLDYSKGFGHTDLIAC
ncbi:pyridoxamine 5'-phosphate oxidase family protein [Bradyrhizobium sp. MOS001]|uniref:pyridoxamine 5'-phosphate oxidase family protein n=1 Tax=Bradyrhizobium sp. MOS001 TaxID=2133948 RepID=UPI00107517D9|nr:pyridoxamine 5'-phosphate oxidase family protein [Bradyrhizobium sp. MOS001]TFW52584.1 pyridoxamine 5'-phosphate oxidase family protein [Bradyrhizobium sp. MOS001]